jgi:hypothetical protein
VTIRGFNKIRLEDDSGTVNNFNIIILIKINNINEIVPIIKNPSWILNIGFIILTRNGNKALVPCGLITS